MVLYSAEIVLMFDSMMSICSDSNALPLVVPDLEIKLNCL